jgi:hypothetical protein
VWANRGIVERDERREVLNPRAGIAAPRTSSDAHYYAGDENGVDSTTMPALALDAVASAKQRAAARLQNVAVISAREMRSPMAGPRLSVGERPPSAWSSPRSPGQRRWYQRMRRKSGADWSPERLRIAERLSGSCDVITVRLNSPEGRLLTVLRRYV